MQRVLLAVLAGLLALAGVAALAVGIAQRTVWLPEDEVSATATLPSDVPLAVTEPGVLEMREGPVTVTVTAGENDTPVVLAVGRTADVEAWVDGAAHARIGGLQTQERLAVRTVDGETEVPDPGTTSDLWTEQEVGTGGATFVYDPPPGSWALLAATNGTVPGPARLTLTWPREVTTPWSVPLIVLGGVLLGTGGAALAWMWVRGELSPVRAGRPRHDRQVQR